MPVRSALREMPLSFWVKGTIAGVGSENDLLSYSLTAYSEQATPNITEEMG